jgi:hypothetical protein
MRKLSFLFALVLTATGSASAQLVSVGALGGIRLTDGFDYDDESRIYDVGGSVEVRLPDRFAVEVDALYQRIGYSYEYFAGPPTISSGATLISATAVAFRERGNLWEFPLLGKYYFRPRAAAWQPFVGAGFALRTASLHSDTSDFRSSLQTGAAIAAGIRFKLGPIALLPQVRYTYWGNYTQSITKNEVTLLLGVTF